MHGLCQSPFVIPWDCPHNPGENNSLKAWVSFHSIKLFWPSWIPQKLYSHDLHCLPSLRLLLWESPVCLVVDKPKSYDPILLLQTEVTVHPWVINSSTWSNSKAERMFYILHFWKARVESDTLDYKTSKDLQRSVCFVFGGSKKLNQVNS